MKKLYFNVQDDEMNLQILAVRKGDLLKIEKVAVVGDCTLDWEDLDEFQQHYYSEAIGELYKEGKFQEA